ncbi:MAG: hypothetical protein WB526_09220, partial [Candidatus Cybelea sp.]
MTSIAAVARPQRLLVGRLTDQLILVCFLISGFCSLLYEVLWTRLAFAHFGIITPVLSLVVSVFMLGLGIGSVFGGRLAASAHRRYNLSPLYLYAAAEAFIALGAFTVPALFRLSGTALIHAGATGSDTFLFISAACIVVALLPWCIAMGATIPLMMAFVRRKNPSAGESFSFLYAANVLGAATGAVMTAIVLIELLGLSGTYTLAAIFNLTIAAIALGLARALPLRRGEPEASNAPVAARSTSG